MPKSKEELLEMQKRLNTLRSADVPMLMDVARNTGPDIAERLELVLAEYSLFIESSLQDIERAEKRRD